MRSRFVIYLFILFCSNQLFGQYTEEPYVPLDTLQSKKLKIIGLPIAFYTPETNFGFGGGGQVFLLRESNRYNLRKSSILVSAIYTLNNQLLIDLNPEIYLMKGDYLLDMMYRFKIFPNSFWGIGGDTSAENEEVYNMTSHEFSVGLIKRLPPYLNFGFEYFFNDYQITEVEEGGILDEGEVPGAEGARISGLGVVLIKISATILYHPPKVICCSSRLSFQVRIWERALTSIGSFLMQGSLNPWENQVYWLFKCIPKEYLEMFLFRQRPGMEEVRELGGISVVVISMIFFMLSKESIGINFVPDGLQLVLCLPVRFQTG